MIGPNENHKCIANDGLIIRFGTRVTYAKNDKNQ